VSHNYRAALNFFTKIKTSKSLVRAINNTKTVWNKHFFVLCSTKTKSCGATRCHAPPTPMTRCNCFWMSAIVWLYCTGLTVVKDAALQHSAKLVCIKVRKTQKAALPLRTRARGLSREIRGLSWGVKPKNKITRVVSLCTTDETRYALLARMPHMPYDLLHTYAHAPTCYSHTRVV